MAKKPNPGDVLVAELTPADALLRLSFLVVGSLQRVADAHGLSLTQTRLLGYLRDREPTMTEIGQAMDLDRSSVSGLVGRAVARGLVERMPASDDRRVVRVRLTTEGRRLTAAGEAGYYADVKALLKHLPKAERAAFSTLAARLVVSAAREAGLEPPAPAPSPISGRG